MSYHFLKPICAKLTRLTEGQLDRWTEGVDEYYSRKKVRDGRTIFVDLKRHKRSGSLGTSTYPFVSVNHAIGAANSDGGDIILLKPGAYDEPVTISKPLTLRATRKGQASIGTSVEPSIVSTN